MLGGSDGDVPGEDGPTPGQLDDSLQPEPGVDEGLEKSGEGLVVPADPAPEPDTAAGSPSGAQPEVP